MNSGKDFGDSFKGWTVGQLQELFSDKTLAASIISQIEHQATPGIKAEHYIAMLAKSLECINESVCISDMNDRIIFINGPFLLTYGYSAEEMIGQKVEMLRSENNDPELIKSIIPQTLAGGWKGEVMNRRKDGTEFPVAITSSVISDKTGKPVAFIGTAIDMTEPRAVEAALRESEEKFRTVFNGARDAIFIMDDRIFLDCNVSTFSIFGGGRDQLIGHGPWEFSPERQPDGSLSVDKAAGFIRAALEGEPQLFEWTHVRFDGVPFHAEVSLNRIMLNAGWFLQAIVRDITKRKEAEDELRYRADELERFNNLMIGRELRMIELKEEINELREQLHLDRKYNIPE